MSRIRAWVVGVFVIASLVAPPLWAVPGQVHYQGRILVGGTPYQGQGLFRFALLDGTGVLLWTNSSSTAGVPDLPVGATVIQGVYSVVLGDTATTHMAALPDGVFATERVVLRIWFDDGVNGVQLLTPDQAVLSVAYARVAGEAETVADGVIRDAQVASDAAIVASKIAGLSPVATTGSYADLVDVPAAIPAAVLGQGLVDTLLTTPWTNAANLASGTIADARLAAGITRDAEVLGIVLGADGAGSTLDADLLDGKDSSAFADATETRDTLTDLGDQVAQASVVQDLFQAISTPDGNTALADSATDTVSLAAANGIDISTNVDTDTVTIGISGLNGNQITAGIVPEARIHADIARDSEIVSTVLAGDGTGSGLDADKLDGLNSDAFAPQLLFNGISTPDTNVAVADQETDTLTLAEANGIDISTNVATDTVTIGISGLDGNQITAGIVAEARIHAEIARDSEIGPAVLANDGTGSGLDADLFDGMNSDAFAQTSHGHTATQVSVADTGNKLTATDVEGALAELADANAPLLFNGISTPDLNVAVADQRMDTLRLAEANGIDISTNVATDTVTIGITALSGGLISSGQIADARIADTIARDGEIVSTVLAGDGTGSGLDADKLDGLNSDRFWKLGGNSGTNVANAYLGTTDGQSFEIRVNGLAALQLMHTGSVTNMIGGSATNMSLDDRGTPFYGTVIMGGQNNTVRSNLSVVGGGSGNVAGPSGATISLLAPSVVAGGKDNSASGQSATIGGGIGNIASGTNSTVPGGASNTAAGQFSFAAGSRAKANHNGAFVWADSNDADWASTAADQMVIRASGGVGIGTNSPGGQLDVVHSGAGDGATAVLGSAVQGGIVRNYGGRFSANGNQGAGVIGESLASTEGAGAGGEFSSLGDNGAGVRASANGPNGRGVEGSGSAFDFYANGNGADYGPFTGAHEVCFDAGMPETLAPGMLVSATGTAAGREVNGTLSLSATLLTVRLANSAADKAILGVLVEEMGLHPSHWYSAAAGERFGIVNALGEGRALVCSINGDIEAGDYITTSIVPGYGMRQDDDVLHSYTLGKATETVDWSTVTETIEIDGQVYKIYLIAIVYTSG